MSKLTEKLNDFTFDGDKTVVVNRDELEDAIRFASEQSTVADGVKLYKSSLDPELEAILRETEGYSLEPEYDEAEYTRPDPRAPSENARRVLEEKADERKLSKKKRTIIICAAAVAALAIILAVVLLIKNSAEKREYNEAYNQAQLLYYDGEYDQALEKLREAMAIDKTDECLILMSQCYEAKNDYVNAIAILESSNSDSDVIKKRIEKLKTAKEKYESGQYVLICGVQYEVTTTVLDLSNKNIHSGRLTDLVKLTELTNLNLSGNQISDLSFLIGLDKLESLDLSKNQITDISPLSELTQLRTLHLDDNKITDFTPLYKLENLTMLTISGIEVKASQMKELKEKLPNCLIYNDEADTDVVEISLGSKTFSSDATKLDLSDCGITDIAQLSICTNLEELDLSGNYISDISPLIDIPNLVIVDLSDNKISDIRPLMSLTTIEHLNLAGNSISSITSLSQLKNLKELVLNDNQLDGTASLAKLGNLKILGLKNTGISDSDLSNLYNLKSLKKLYLEGNGNLSEAAVAKLEEKLTGCTVSHSELTKNIELGGKQFASNAETVNASGLGLSEVSAASGFTAVKSMDLSGNIITNVSPLSNLKTLESLNLSDNNIADVTPLYSLRNLKKLDISKNGLTDEQISNIKAALPNCTIIVD